MTLVHLTYNPRSDAVPALGLEVVAPETHQTLCALRFPRRGETPEPA